MELFELKQAILDNTVSDNLIIFKCDKDDFIAEQYIDEICSRKGYLKNNINSISEINDSALSLVFDYKSDLNILKVDEFSEFVDDYSELKNVVVICYKIDKEIEKLAKEYIITIPKLLDWQIKDYMKVICPGLEDNSYDKLYKVTSGDIYKITNELDKIKIFEEKDRQFIFNKLIFDKMTDLFSMEYTNMLHAVEHRDLDILFEYFKHQKTIDTKLKLTFVGVANSLAKHIKNIAIIRDSAGWTKELEAAKVCSSQKQYNFMKYNEKFKYTNSELRKISDFFSSISMRLKNYEFDDVSQETCCSYIIFKALEYLK